MIEQADLELIDSALEGPLNFLYRVTEPAEIGTIDPGRLAKLYICCALIAERTKEALEPEIERSKARHAKSVSLVEMAKAPGLCATEFPEYWEEWKEAAGQLGILGIAHHVDADEELAGSTVFVDECHPMAALLDGDTVRDQLRVVISKSWGRILPGGAIDVQFVSRT